MPTHACKQAVLLRCQAGIFPAGLFPAQAGRAGAVYLHKRRERGLPSYCASPPSSQGLPSSLLFP